MMAATIPDALRPRLGRFIRLLASDQPGEVVAAASALKRALASCGADLNDLGDAIERPAAVVVERQARRGRKARPGDVELDPAQRRSVMATLRLALAGDRLSPWEIEFATSILERLRADRGQLTKRQSETLRRLLGKLGEGSAWV